MPRTARLTVENAYYHIITRGNQKQFVFVEPPDYNAYLSMLAKYKKRYKFKLYCYCLMPNHVHLVMEVKDPNELSTIMKCLNLSYTLYFNFKYKKVGHLWQDRFKSRIIENDAYLLECIKYIENNPVRASIVSDLEKYPWSSYRSKVMNDNILDNLFSI